VLRVTSALWLGVAAGLLSLAIVIALRAAASLAPANRSPPAAMDAMAGDASPPALPSDDAPEAADGASASPASPQAMASQVRAARSRWPDARDHPQQQDRGAGGMMNR
jgi:hypothetical protein